MSAINVNGLDFHYVTRGKVSEQKALHDINLSFPTASRVLVVGQNGAGKSTLLKILAGRVMVPKGKCLVLERDAFHDTTLSKNVSYLGEWWSQSRNFLDVTVKQILNVNADPERVAKLCEVLRVDVSWKLGHLSDGQLRRAQILFGLSQDSEVIILDEITTDVDLLVREDLLAFLKAESERGCTVLYATHIFEGLEDWPTHILRLQEGTASLIALEDIPEAKEPNFTYFKLVRNWLREERRIQERVGKGHWALQAEGLKVG